MNVLWILAGCIFLYLVMFFIMLRIGLAKTRYFIVRKRLARISIIILALVWPVIYVLAAVFIPLFFSVNLLVRTFYLLITGYSRHTDKTVTSFLRSLLRRPKYTAANTNTKDRMK